MAQLTYDELRLLRQLERGDQTISDNQPRGGLDQLVDEGYVMRRLLNPSQTVHSITAKGRAANDDHRLFLLLDASIFCRMYHRAADTCLRLMKHKSVGELATCHSRRSRLWASEWPKSRRVDREKGCERDHPLQSTR